MVVAAIEGFSVVADGHTYLSPTTEIVEVTGQVHAGGASQEQADALLRGYWLLCLWDRDADGVLGPADYPLSYEAHWFEPAGGDEVDLVRHRPAVGWDGGHGNLLAPAVSFTVTRGRKYLLAIVAFAADGTRSANLSWTAPRPGSVATLTESELAELLGLTADGLPAAAISDYEALGVRVNRIDPPRRL